MNNSMYTAFLLNHGDELRYRLFTSEGEDARNDALDETTTPGGAPTSMPPFGSAEEPLQERNADTTIPVAAATAAAAATCMQSSWLKLTRRHIHILNISAALVHAMLFVVIYSLAVGKGKQAWRLKQDRVQVVPKSVGDKTPFVSITNDKCNLAKPNIMEWEGSDIGAMQLWSYPQDSGINIDLAWCVIMFFALSFVFQMGVSVYSFITKNRGYNSIFHNDLKTDMDTDWDTMQSKAFLATDPGVAEISGWCSDILAFNWARFVEYTFSGSLVLFTIALIAGIADFELLLCIYVLGAACMLMGLGAEYCMRIYFSLQMMARSQSGGLPDYAKKLITDIICPQLRGAFWILHGMAWVCILVPW